MSAIEMRSDILKWVDQVDETFLSAVHAMMGTYVEKQEEDPILGYEADGTAVTASVFLEQAEEDLAAVDRGEFITIEELEKESEEWLSATK
ncbi:MAG: hypothetical protein AAF433_14975 [Bacteroidota bacterium]